jgi:hypothetical protein
MKGEREEKGTREMVRGIQKRRSKGRT